MTRLSRVVGLAVMTVVALTSTGCGLVGDQPPNPVVDREKVAHPYDGPMHAKQSFADRASVEERSGAAALALECTYPPYQGGAGDYDSGLESVQRSPGAALGDWLEEEGVDLPDEDYVIEREDDGRALMSFDVDGQTKVAVIAADDVRDFDDDVGWGVESWASCDPAELGADFVSNYGVRVWSDADGNPVPVSTVQSFPGAEHCDWQDITFLLVGPERSGDLYLRDTTGELRSLLRTTYADDVSVPRDARDTGWHHDGQELWLQPGHPDAAYLVSLDHPQQVERWPAAKPRGVGCA
jgi:hypothetical protein